jgi:serine protease Do
MEPISSAPILPGAAWLTPRRPRRRTRRPQVATIAVALISAVLASVMTLGATGLLAATGALTGQAAPTAASATSTNASSTVEADPDKPIVDVAAAVSPAVVTITSTIAGNGRNPFSASATGIGSGVIFGANGWILTNWHVVEGADTLTVTLMDGRELTGRVVASDKTLDLAVVRVDASGLPTAEIGSSADLQVGQLVIAIGSPLGEFTETVTSGILSATGRTITVTDAQTGRPKTMKDLLQTDAAINQGNSGGPLLDGAGRVIGINSAGASAAEGIGFAIPIDKARSLMEQATTGAVS